MTYLASLLLPGVPEAAVRQALSKAAGNELESGKLLSQESSAALAVNTFGWFLERASDLPALPALTHLDWPAKRVDVERQMRFPWRGGHHPWLDAAIKTDHHLIGVESKRFEPFRDKKSVDFSDAYYRDVWGQDMAPYQKMRDDLKGRAVKFEFLDAAQLVKHAFGLVTEGQRIRKKPVLFYLYAEPRSRGAKEISPRDIDLHRAEVSEFSKAVAGAEVTFASSSYREWLELWAGATSEHAQHILQSFEP